jgi:serine/threonine protein kinase
VAHLLERCCDALSYANANGVIHRDLKPANILMGADGEAKVADFGVAFSNLTFDTTRSMTVGSPAYMAPEQLEGKPASMKSDMYSMGIVLYKMLTASLPFTASSAVELAKRIVAGACRRPAPRAPGVPPQLDAIFAKATSLDPQSRYATWEDFAARAARRGRARRRRKRRERARQPASRAPVLPHLRAGVPRRGGRHGAAGSTCARE